jgi:two-component system, LytTR family, sensor histidine kinase AlgZ
MEAYKPYEFIFSSKFRVWRHLVFWLTHALFTAFVYSNTFGISRNLFHDLVWLPAYFVCCYPLMYLVIPKFLLKGKLFLFICITSAWVIAVWFFNYLFRTYVFIPIQEYMGFKPIVRGGYQPGSYLMLISTAAGGCLIILFKYWLKKQQEWLQAEKEKATAELQLLKAQVHPHFLFNTLNNIYSFSLENSSKTPGLILKLSSLLSYILYDCKANEVLLQKELEVMKNYIDLEKERYGNKLEISLNIEGDLRDQLIAPLLLLPFLENAFKHGTSEQLDKPWLSMDIAVKQHTIRCKIANSKNDFIAFNKTGIGIENVKKRLAFLYPGKYELKMHDEGNFFVVSLLINLENKKRKENISLQELLPVTQIVPV